jgi:hypothetical protein
MARGGAEITDYDMNDIDEQLDYANQGTFSTSAFQSHSQDYPEYPQTKNAHPYLKFLARLLSGGF